jgi:hypothetical protein
VVIDISLSAGLTDFFVRECNSMASWVFQTSRSQCCRIGFFWRPCRVWITLHILQDITNGMEKSIFHKSNSSAYCFKSEWKQSKVVHGMVDEEFFYFEHISVVIIFLKRYRYSPPVNQYILNF